jgi:hypothetical protein
LEDLDDGIDAEDQNFPFILYAGPWSHACARWGTDPPVDEDSLDNDGRRFSDLVVTEMQNNLSDFGHYERAMGGDPEVVRKLELDRIAAHIHGKDDNEVVRPPISQPDPTWHHEMLEIWPQISELAKRLLAGDDGIDVGLNTLFRAQLEPLRWLKPGADPLEPICGLVNVIPRSGATRYVLAVSEETT